MHLRSSLQPLNHLVMSALTSYDVSLNDSFIITGSRRDTRRVSPTNARPRSEHYEPNPEHCRIPLFGFITSSLFVTSCYVTPAYSSLVATLLCCSRFARASSSDSHFITKANYTAAKNHLLLTLTPTSSSYVLL